MTMLALTWSQGQQLVEEEEWEKVLRSVFIFSGVHAIGVIDVIYFIEQLLMFFLHFLFVLILILNIMTVTLSILVS